MLGDHLSKLLCLSVLGMRCVLNLALKGRMMLRLLLPPSPRKLHEIEVVDILSCVIPCIALVTPVVQYGCEV